MNKDKISKLGYKKNSPYKNRESLTIGSNFITTEDMAFPILAMGDGGESQVLYPNTGSYLFPNSSKVQEYKLDSLLNKNTNTGMKNIMANGGMMNEYDILSSYLPTLSPEDQDTFIESYQRSNPRQKQEILMKCGGIMKYQQGGSVPSTQPMPKGMQVPREMANAEVEGGETAMNPNGVLMQFNGPSHKQGGIPTMLEGGTKVFSDHLKVPVEIQKELGVKRPNKKTTYADISKRFLTEKHMQTLADTKDKYKRNAAEIQLQKNLAMLETLFFAQEQDKMMKEMNNPANMQMQAPMQQPMTDDGLIFAQFGAGFNPRGGEEFMRMGETNQYYDPYTNRQVFRDERTGKYFAARDQFQPPSEKEIQAHLERYPSKDFEYSQQNANISLTPIEAIAGIINPYRKPARMSTGSSNYGQAQRVMDTRGIVASDAERRSGFYEKPFNFGEDTSGPIQGSFAPRPPSQAIGEDLSTVSDRFIVNKDGSVTDPISGQSYIRNQDGSYTPMSNTTPIGGGMTITTGEEGGQGRGGVNTPRTTGTKKRVSPQQAQFDQMWGEEMYDYARNNPNVVLPNSGLYTSETGGRDIPVDISIPRTQSSRAGQRVYGEQDWTKGQLFEDFKTRHAEFFAQNPNFDPTKRGDTKKFQEWYEAKAKQLGMPSYFNANKKFSGIDDKFGQYTWSAPSLVPPQTLPGPVTTPAPVQPDPAVPDSATVSATPQAFSSPAVETKPAQIAPEIDRGSEIVKKEKYPFGINSKLLGSLIDVGVVLGDRLSIDSPPLYNRQKNPMFNRFYEFDNLETQRLANQQIQSIMNSNMPEQVKQAQIAQITAKSQDQQARVDFANAQRYEQKREADLAKLQTYTDANLDTRIADYDNWRQRMARVKDMQNQFKSWRKQQLVGTLKDQLGYMEKLKSINELNPYFERSWLTGTDRYKPQAPSSLNIDPTQGYDIRSRQMNLGDGITATDMGDFYIIRDAKGEVKIQEKKEQKSNKISREEAAAKYKFGGYKY